MKISVFKNFNQIFDNVTIDQVLQTIKQGKHQQYIIELRQIYSSGNKKEYDTRKKCLPAFTPSGLFEGGRKLQNLKEYSNFIILDLDKIHPGKLQKLKQQITTIPYTYTVFLSPSGYGLKILVRVDSSIHHHLKAFNQVREYYEKQLMVPADTSGKDVTRLCFLSYDPEIFINTDSTIFNVIIEDPGEQNSSTENNIDSDIESVVRKIESSKVDITNNYQDWLRIAFSLIDGLGPSSRDYFHRVSKLCGKYDHSNCEKQFDNCLKSQNSGITIKTFFYIAKFYGIEVGHKKVLQSTNKSDEEQPVTQVQNIDSNTGKTASRTKKATKRHGINKFHLVRDYLDEKFDIRFNVISTQYEYREKGKVEYLPMNENNIYIKMSLDGLTFSINNLMAFLKSDLIAKYNPFTDYFESLPVWSGEIDHISNLASFVNLKHDVRVRFDNLFKKWLVRTVKCALVDTYFNKQAFILVHDRQNSGKSTFCRFLCPPALSNYIAENISIDKDSRILLTTNLLINLDELSTLSRFEINSLKSLFSKDKINERLPYDRKNSIISRRASFIGSTNQAEFLNDETGSVRWLCFNIESIDWSYKEKVNIDDIWSQAYYLFKTGFQCDLTPEEIKDNDEYNRQFHITTAEFELIHKHLSPASKESNDCFMSSTDILIYLTELTGNKVRLNTNNIGKALKLLSFTREKKYPERSYGYYIFKKVVD